VVVTGASPPLYLKPKFDEVTQATQKREKMLNDAQSYATSTTNRAQGEADTIIKVADAARKWKVDTIAAQADKFKKELAQYEQDPELFKRIRQMLVLEDVYTNVMEKMLVPPSTEQLRLQITRELQEPSVANIPTQP
jgi:regulator of protease activity HflC (stomatin/prohibitin superfamily)